MRRHRWPKSRDLDLNTNQLFKWRRAHLRHLAAQAAPPGPPAARLLPVTLEAEPAAPQAAAAAPAVATPVPEPGTIELVAARGVRLRVCGRVDLDGLGLMLDRLRLAQ